LESAGRRSSIMGVAVSNSIYRRIASSDDAFVAALVEERPFSTKDGTV
jgi:hypothetical protein